MMDDRFEATFVVRTTPDETWEVLAGGRRADDTWWLPGFDTVAPVEEVDDGKRVRVRKVHEPCANTEIVVTVEAADTGTKVTIVQSGFGTEFFAAAVNELSVGWSHILADFALYLERDVKGGRHMMPWGSLGCTVQPTANGLVVDSVWGGFAQTNGMQAGDVLLSIGGAPLCNVVELCTALRALQGRDNVAVTWARDRELVSAVGTL
jgi:hypothetical protein